MTILSPNEIAFAIYWCGAKFGPSMAPPATQGPGGQIVTHIPKPGSPERTKLENWLDTAIAICLAESGGNPDVKNPNSSATGLWQIMVSVHGPEIKFAQAYWASNRANGKVPPITDPLVNTNVAAQIYQASGWNAWVTFIDGSYKKHLGHGKAAYAFLTNKDNLKRERQRFLQNMKDDTALSQYVQDLAGGLTGAGIRNPIDSAISKILAFIATLGIPVGLFILGIILLGFGIWTIVSHTPAGRSVKTAVKVATKV
jgi:hypothetical protein